MEKKSDPAKGLYAAGPQQQFISSALSMGWQLAAVFLIPVIGGLEIDKHFKTSPLFTLVGFVIAIAAACLIVWKSVKDLNNLVTPSSTTEKKK
jgi:F0F1-type ATP synthase assembly protein I